MTKRYALTSLAQEQMRAFIFLDNKVTMMGKEYRTD